MWLILSDEVRTDADTAPRQDFLDENGQRKQHFLLRFHKTVIGDQTREEVYQMFTDISLKCYN